MQLYLMLLTCTCMFPCIANLAHDWYERLKIGVFLLMWPVSVFHMNDKITISLRKIVSACLCVLLVLFTLVLVVLLGIFVYVCAFVFAC